MINLERVLMLHHKLARDYVDTPELDPMSAEEERLRVEEYSEESVGNALGKAVLSDDTPGDEQFPSAGTSHIDGVKDTSTLLKPGQDATPNVPDVDFGAGSGYNDALTYGSLPDGSKGPLYEYVNTPPESRDRTGDPWSGGGLYSKESRELYKIMRDDNHHRKRNVFIENARHVSVTMDTRKESLAKGSFVFRCRAPGGTPHTVAFQFLKKPGSTQGIRLMDHDVLLGCDCNAFDYWGPRYYATTRGYMHRDLFHETSGSLAVKEPEDYVPGTPGRGKFGKGKDGTFCKHMVASYAYLKSWIDSNADSVVFNLSESLEGVHESVHSSEMRSWMSDMGVESYKDLEVLFNNGWRDKAKVELIHKRVQKIIGSDRVKMDAAETLMNKWWSYTQEFRNATIDALYESPSIALWILFGSADKNGSIDQSVRVKLLRNVQGVLHLPYSKLTK